MDYRSLYDLWTFGPSVDEDLAYFSRVNFWEFLIQSTVVQDGPSMPPLVAPADFSKIIDFRSIFATGC